MGTIVQKFGGTSVGDTTKIMNVAKHAIREKENNHHVVVVVSAMAGETDRLLNLADEIDPAGSPRERDMLVSTGEQVSIALTTMAIQKLGYQAVSYTGPQIGIHTDEGHSKAKITSIETARFEEAFKANQIVVVAGFQGVSDDHQITTLGRGGSDTTAVAIAAVLKADRCDIFTDVDGVYAADPRIVPRVRKIPALAYEETLEMASAGAKVLHARSVLFAAKYKVPLQVLSSFENKPGTLITQEVAMENVVVTAVTQNTKEAKISISGIADRPGTAAEVFRYLSEHNINVDMIIQNVGDNNLADISCTVERTDLPYLKKNENSFLGAINAQSVKYDDKIAKVSVIGVGMRNHTGVASRMFNCLAEKGINILMISTSEIRISCVIHEDYTELAVRSLCEEFGLEETDTDIEG